MKRLTQLVVIISLSAVSLGLCHADSPLDAPAFEPDNPVDETSVFYDPDVVQRIDLEIAASDLQRMHDALPKRVYVPGIFRWNDHEISNVGIRYKGNSSSSPHQAHKRSFLVKFSEFVGGQRFLGLRRVALDNGVQFGSLFSERILGDILRAYGVIVSRSNYANVYLNGDYMGVYVNVERIDQSFLDRYFADSSGSLYKVDTGGPGSDLNYLGDESARYARAFEIKTNKSTAQHSEIVELVRAIHGTPDSAFESWFMERFDGEGFLWLMPVMLLGGAFDQYTGFGAHNYYLYHEPTLDRWYYIVWDLDVGFADNAFGRVPVIDGWDASYPLPVGATRPLIQRIIANPKLLAAYRAHAADALETHFRPEKIAARLDALYALIASDLAREPFRPGRITVPGETSWAETIASMKAFAQTRYDKAVSQLANPADHPPDIAPPRRDEPMPGRPSPFDPTNLTAVVSAEGAVELSWTDNAPDEFATIVQKCVGQACTDFRNAMGFPQADTTSAVDRQVRAGQAYRYRVYAMRPGIGGTGTSNVVSVTVGREAPGR